MLVARVLSPIAVLVSFAIASPVHAEQPDTVTPDDDPPTAAPSARVTARPIDSDMQHAKLLRNWGIATLSSGVALVGVGAGFEVWRLGHACKDVKISDRNETCNRDMAAHAALITMASGVAILGAVLIGVGQSRLTRARRGQARVALAPAFGRGFASATFSLRF